MDDPLRENLLDSLKREKEISLNPYCNGWSSKRRYVETSAVKWLGLNPYCNGWSSKRFDSIEYSVKESVLILIVMDDPLRGLIFSSNKISILSVLILIVMDDPLRVSS